MAFLKSARSVETATEIGYHRCDRGLYLQVAGSGTKSWLFRYKSPVTAKQREMGLGSLNLVSLAAARDIAVECRRQVLSGLDPLEERARIKRARHLEQARSITFQEAAEHGTQDPALLRAGALIAQKAQRRDLEAERWSALVELTPDDIEAVRRAAVAVSALGDLEAAKKLVNDGLALQPTHMALLSLKGNIAGRMQEWGESIAAWKVYGAHYEVTPFVMAQTSRALRGLERLDDAKMIIQAGLADTPDSKDLLIENARIADSYLAVADSAAKPDAETARLNAWKAAIEVGTTDSIAWQKLILAHLEDGQTAEAEDALAQARAALTDTTRLLANSRIAALAERVS